MANLLTYVQPQVQYTGFKWLARKTIPHVSRRREHKSPTTVGQFWSSATVGVQKRQRNIARRTPGAVTVEAVDMKDLVTFARTFRPSSDSALSHLVNFAHSVMTKVNTDSFIRRIDTLQAGRATNPATEAEQAALAFLQAPSNRTALGVLSGLERQKGVRRFRPSLLSACIKALHLSGSSEESALFDAAIRVREQYRQAGRSLPRRAVGSTLLVKGLESDVAVVLDADHLSARNLYVAMTRGSKMLKICSQTPYLRVS